MHISEPTLLLDKKKCIRNINMMLEKAKNNQLIIRPHFKTHQSHEIGQWFRERGVQSITVSSLKMAEYFAEDGWNDITVAFPVNVLEMDRINRLTSKITLNLCVESLEAMQLMANQLSNPVSVFIKTDIGYHRTGIDADNIEYIRKLIEAIEGHQLFQLKGFLAHAGHSYKSRGKEEIAKVHTDSLNKLKSLKDQFEEEYPELVYSIGDTPTCSVMNDFGVASEIRPGNFVFYDLSQWQIGSNHFEQIAVALACPVVAKHYDRNEVVLYGGGVHFSKERMTLPTGPECYGLPVPFDGKNWGEPDQNIYVKSLSQEHGIIKANKAYLDSISVGDVVVVLPVHSCMTANLTKQYITLAGELIPKL